MHVVVHKTEANQKSIEKIYCMDFGCVELSCVALEWHHGDGRCFQLLLPLLLLLALLAAVAEPSRYTARQNISANDFSTVNVREIESNRMEWK